MSFFSLPFALAFTGLFLLWWALPVKIRPGLLALANLLFALLLGLRVALVLLLITAIGWCCGLILKKKPTTPLLCAGIAALLLPLALYKYLPVLAGHFLWAADFAQLLAPLGLSFYTFKSVSYLIEVKKGSLAPILNPAAYFAYVGFFAQLPMGPIQRPEAFFAQLSSLPQALSCSKAFNACTRICWALFLKLCLADFLAGFLSALKSPEYYYSLSMLWSLGAYCLYLYLDFAAFSQIAIGFGELLGLSCGENFKSPYFSRSIGEFWRRWHISLSSFLKDYVYIPLGGSRCGTARLILATMVTFLLSGVWHGATGGFLLWGALHGIYLLCGRLTKNWRSRFWAGLPRFFAGPIRSLCAWAFTMLLVCTGWFIFYAGTLPHAMQLLSHMLAPAPFSLQYVKESLVLLGLTPHLLIKLALLLCPVALVDFASRDQGFGAWAAKLRPAARVLFCYGCIFAVMFFGVGGSLPGVYFTF